MSELALFSKSTGTRKLGALEFSGLPSLHYLARCICQDMPKKNRLYTVICQWHPGIDACDNWQTVAVVLRNDFDAKDAANEACLFLIWKRQGQVQPLLVIEGAPKLTVPSDGIFDAEEYDDTVTFARGKIVSCRDIG